MSDVRVRFAPSPTGYLHIGGARTALYSYLYAKRTGGKFILRIEDTDLERSKREYEESQIADLKWLGLNHDEGPDKPGEFGPYRQSERLDIYKKYANDLVEQGKAYYCFLSSEELDELTDKANAEKKSPHTYHGKYRDLPLEEARKKVEAGQEHVVRFKNPGKSWEFTDLVRGTVKFPEDMVGDFVIMRSNGMPVYNFCCVLDDHLMKISHVIRAEEHLNNTVRQLMIYEAIGAETPKFCHVSLLVGEDRQKLSKRHGATSVSQYREQNYLPQALVNYLALLGWSHPEEIDIFSLKDIEPIFDLNRFNKSPALYDIAKLNHFNAQHIKNMANEDLKNIFNENEKFFSQSDGWKDKFVAVFKEKLESLNDLEEKLDEVFSPEIESGEDVKDALSWETTTQMKEYLASELESIDGEISEETVSEWMNHLKKELKIKGKFLFMGLRVLLTGKCHGPDLKGILTLSPLSVTKERFSKI